MSFSHCARYDYQPPGLIVIDSHKHIGETKSGLHVFKYAFQAVYRKLVQTHSAININPKNIYKLSFDQSSTSQI